MSGKDALASVVAPSMLFGVLAIKLYYSSFAALTGLDNRKDTPLKKRRYLNPVISKKFSCENLSLGSFVTSEVLTEAEGK